MHQIQLLLRVIGPGERAVFPNPEGGESASVYKEPGVDVNVTVNGRTAILGRLDPADLDPLMEAIEAATENMDYEHYRDTNLVRSPEVGREGWGLRWVEHSVQWLRREISNDLSNAVERLAKRHDQLGRFK